MKIFCISSLFFLAVAMTACSSNGAPGPLSVGPPPAPRIGAVSAVSSVSTCPADFYPGMTCSRATVSCANTDDISVVYGFKTPPGTVKGTIFLHAGSGGKTAFSYGPPGATYVDSYFKSGYRVVELEWAGEWEIATKAGPENVKLAACRPATIVKYVYDNVHGGAGGAGAMCAHGDSAGAAAMAYALTWYNSDAFLDKVVLTSGPVAGDIEAGCKVPNVPPITVCSSGQYGCVGAGWLDAPQYQPGSNALQQWTGDRSCNNVSAGQSTSSSSNAAWKTQSIVDGTPAANFSYPKTALSGWLCSNGLNPSAAQAQYYFQNFKGASQAAAFSVNRIDGCIEAEDVWNGTTVSGQSGFDASVNDMLDPVAGCVKRH